VGAYAIVVLKLDRVVKLLSVETIHNPVSVVKHKLVTDEPKLRRIR